MVGKEIEKASRSCENGIIENIFIKEAICVIHTHIKAIKKFKRIVTKFMNTLKTKEEESKRMAAYFTCQI